MRARTNIIQFSAPGKVMLSGEYAVLSGAKAILLPTKFRQHITARTEHSDKLFWKSFYYNNCFFEGEYSWNKERFIKTNDPGKALYIEKILKACTTLKSEILNSVSEIETYLDFSPDWGMGSSASLIVNLSRIFNLNPIAINILVSRGSGADINCSLADTPISFSKAKGNYQSKPLKLNLPFRDKLWFIYLGKKQKTETEVLRSLKTIFFPKHELAEIDALSETIVSTSSLDKFESAIRRHEMLISQHIRIPTLQQSLFSDFEGIVKSLGAWGGDMALVTWRGDEQFLRDYLFTKNIGTFFHFNQLVNYEYI